jgi:hypothetical protein
MGRGGRGAMSGGVRSGDAGLGGVGKRRHGIDRSVGWTVGSR